MKGGSVWVAKDHPLIPSCSSKQTDGHQSAIRDILRTLLASHTDSVLTLGLRLDGQSIVYMWPNEAIKEATSRSWEMIHGQIGTEMLRFLLIQCTVYVSRETGTTLQISGPKPAKRPRDTSPSVFYNTRYLKRAGFEPEHILHSHLLGIVGRLHRDIFGFDGTLPGLGEMVGRHYRIRFGILLNACCPIKDTLHTSQDQVVSFVWNCLLKLIPKRFLGKNKWVLRDTLKRFIETPRKIPQVPWRVKGCSEWLPKYAHRFHREWINKWIDWMFKQLIMPLVRNHFYVTESGVVSYGRHVFYYRKQVWRRLEKMAHVEERIRLEHILAQTNTSIRLLPTLGNFRVIQRAPKQESWNLLIVLRALFYELKKRPDVLGASVFGFDDVYQKVLSFKRSIQGKPLYAVKVDIKSAYDSIDQRKLCELIDRLDIFKSPSYCVQRFRVNGKFKLFVGIEPREVPIGLVVDYAWGEFVSRESLQSLLYDHISFHLVKYRGKTYLQNQGISQGSVLSSLLCSIYYADAMKEYVQEPESLRMRWVDDTFFLTTSRESAKRFIEGLEVPLSWSKCVFDLSLRTIAWCGLTFHLDSCEVSWDYSRYADMTRADARHDNFKLVARAKFRLRILFSSLLNSPETCSLNFTEALSYVVKKSQGVPFSILYRYCKHLMMKHFP